VQQASQTGELVGVGNVDAQIEQTKDNKTRPGVCTSQHGQRVNSMTTFIKSMHKEKEKCGARNAHIHKHNSTHMHVGSVGLSISHTKVCTRGKASG
jgi:hypothetical protein